MDENPTDLAAELRREAALVIGNGITGKSNRSRIAKLMTRCARALTAAAADKARLDWLADVENPIGAVTLPTACVMNNLHDMRAAIDAAMQINPNDLEQEGSMCAP